ncbi:MAG: DUF1697 domain-containing protein [Phycisphaerales bacterium]
MSRPASKLSKDPPGAPLTPLIALLRGINVGGRNLLPMPPLAAICESVGCSGVKTYIQSGNVILRAKPGTAARLQSAIPDAIEKAHGFRPLVIFRTLKELNQAIADNPFPGATADPKLLHVGFLAEPPPKTAAALDPARSPGDRFALRGRELYIHYAAGVHTSKLTYAYIESTLKTPCTFRNWNTVLKLADLAKAGQP